MSIALNCVLFTCKDRAIEDNKYIPIFYMWLVVLQQRSGLKQSDTLYIHIDKETFDYMNSENEVFGEILEQSPCRVQFLFYERPTTLLEGMMFKYTIHDYKEDVFLYCDIDIFIMNSLHTITDSLQKDTIFLHSEGSLTNTDYGAAFSEEELLQLSGSAGFSAGKFFIRGKELLQVFFTMIKKYHTICAKKNFECMEQPYFNKAIYSFNTERLDVDLLSRTAIISWNGVNYTKDATIFLDNMGVSGDGQYHYNKMFKFFLLIQSGNL